jgi:hypothetical protein
VSHQHLVKVLPAQLRVAGRRKDLREKKMVFNLFLKNMSKNVLWGPGVFPWAHETWPEQLWAL